VFACYERLQQALLALKVATLQLLLRGEDGLPALLQHRTNVWVPGELVEEAGLEGLHLSSVEDLLD